MQDGEGGGSNEEGGERRWEGGGGQRRARREGGGVFRIRLGRVRGTQRMYKGCMGGSLKGAAHRCDRLLSGNGMHAGGKRGREQEQPEGAASAA